MMDAGSRMLSRSFVPQALLLLPHIVAEVVALPTRLDAAPIARVDLIIVY